MKITIFSVPNVDDFLGRLRESVEEGRPIVTHYQVGTLVIDMGDFNLIQIYGTDEEEAKAFREALNGVTEKFPFVVTSAEVCFTKLEEFSGRTDLRGSVAHHVVSELRLPALGVDVGYRSV